MKTVCRYLRSVHQSRTTILTRLAATCFAITFTWTVAAAEPAGQAGPVTYPQVSEAACPTKVVSIPGKAGNVITAVVRQPPGSGPFPAIVLLHGGLSPYPLEKLKDESLTRPNYARFLA